MAPTAITLGRFPVVEEPPQDVHGGIGDKGPTLGNGVCHGWGYHNRDRDHCHDDVGVEYRLVVGTEHSRSPSEYGNRPPW